MDEFEAAMERTERLMEEAERTSLRILHLVPQLEEVDRLIRGLQILRFQNPALWAFMQGLSVVGGISGAYERMYAEAEEQVRLNRLALDEQHRRGVPP